MPRPRRWGRTLAAAALSLLLGAPALAGTTGRLIGYVVDEKEQPLPGVIVQIEGSGSKGSRTTRGPTSSSGSRAGTTPCA